jgi:glucuronoxylan 4-O-methyltransferase
MGVELDQDLRDLVANNPGQGSLEEYQLLRNTIREKAPCNLLIFGVGKDSRFWVEANRGGHTVFVEHEPEWIQKTREMIPGVTIHQVTYGTKRPQWKRLLHRQDLLFMEDLPNEVLATNWDVIFVDSPQGGTKKRPGRMKSIYTASVLAKRSTDVHVLVHDCNRKVEQVYSDTYLGPERMLSQTRTLRHYFLRPTQEKLRIAS